MTDKKDNQKGLLGADELKLWEIVTKSISPLPGRTVKKQDPAIGKEPVLPPVKGDAVNTPSPLRRTKRGKGIDGHIKRKLDKGEIRPQARLDLHGRTQDEAKNLIIDFILASKMKGHRLVLIVTGTGERSKAAFRHDSDPGRSEPGVLKRRFHDFIRDPGIDNDVLYVKEAHRRHGGNGAYYVYLRQKSPSP